MKVILLKDIPNVGKQSQVLEVKPGYAHNYLFPKGLAVVANDENMKKLAAEIAAQKANEALIKQNAADLKKVIDEKAVTVSAKSGPDGKLYGAVTAKDIAEAIAAALDVEIDKRKILTDAIKTTGRHEIKIKLHPEVESTLYVDDASE